MKATVNHAYPHFGDPTSPHPRSEVPRRSGRGMLAALAGVLVGAVPAAAAGVARVTLVHGVKGLVADVALDHKVVLSGFKFQHVTGVLDVPAGKHRIQIFKAGTRTNPQLDVSVTLKAGQDLTAVAALGKGDKRRQVGRRAAQLRRQRRRPRRPHVPPPPTPLIMKISGGHDPRDVS